MPQQNIFRWRNGRGWIVLSGGGSTELDAVSHIAARVLGRTVSQGPLAYIWAAGDIEAADRDMDALRDLGARTGYLVDILTEDDTSLRTQLQQAGVIILGDGPDTLRLRHALPGVVLESIESAFERGATIYGIGQSATILGAYGIESAQIVQGLEWLTQAVIMAHYTPEQADLLREWIHESNATYGLGLGQGAALAFGPRGDVEVWGNQAITVTLGEQYHPGSSQ